MCRRASRSPDTSSCFIPKVYQSIPERREESASPPERRRLFSISDQTEALQMEYSQKKKKRKNREADGKDEGIFLQQLVFHCRHKACGRPADSSSRAALMDVSLRFASIHHRERRPAGGRGRREEPSCRQVRLHPCSNKSLLVWIQGPRTAAGIFMDLSSTKHTLPVSAQGRLMQQHGRWNTTKC